jgi:hypothetical protein
VAARLASRISFVISIRRNAKFCFAAALRGSASPRKQDRTSIVPMPTPARYGTSRAYILARLRREGMTDLADAIKRKQVSAYAIACELGWQKRRKPLGTGSRNASRRRAFRLRELGL